MCTFLCVYYTSIKVWKSKKKKRHAHSNIKWLTVWGIDFGKNVYFPQFRCIWLQSIFPQFSWNIGSHKTNELKVKSKKNMSAVAEVFILRPVCSSPLPICVLSLSLFLSLFVSDLCYHSKKNWIWHSVLFN